MNINWQNPSNKQRKEIKWINLKRSFKREQEGKGFIYCWYCGRNDLIESVHGNNLADNVLTVDHIVAHKDKAWKKLDRKNLAVCCNKCNNLKGGKSLDDFLESEGLVTVYKRLRLKRREKELLGGR